MGFSYPEASVETSYTLRAIFNSTRECSGALKGKIRSNKLNREKGHGWNLAVE